jgi:hypothetical protein
MSLMTLVNVVRATVPYEWQNYARDREWQRDGRPFQSPLGEALNRDGIASVPGYLPVERCDGIREQIERAIDGVVESGRHASGAEIDVRRENDGREPYDTGMLDIRHVDRIVPEIAQIFAAPQLIEAIAEACGQRVTCQNCNALVNRSVLNPRAYHSDSTGIVQFKAFIYLTDVPDPSYGPYCYVKGTHRLRWDKYANFAVNWWKGRPITDMRTHDESQEVRMIAPRGTLILSNQNGFHRGWPQQPGRSRCMILGNYVAA